MPAAAVSGGAAQAGQEAIDAFEQRGGVRAEVTGGGEDIGARRARLVGSRAGAGDVDRDSAGAGGSLLHAARNLAGRRILFLDRRRDGGGDAADLPDGFADAADRGDATAGGRLDRRDLPGDLLGGLRGLAGHGLDL